MLRKVPLIAGEAYHVFNRGAHKQAIFTCEDDYTRFLGLLYLSNHKDPIVVRDIIEKSKHRGRFSGEIFSEPVDKSLVDVLGYCLMPNHFHLILRQRSEAGITMFMRKVSVGYSMYFNLKHGHSGTLFQGRFKSSHLGTDPHFQWIFPYVHLNPISIVEPGWKEKRIGDLARAKDFLAGYAYSSYVDYYIIERPERALLSYEEATHFIDRKDDMYDLLADYARGRVLYRDASTEQ